MALTAAALTVLFSSCASSDEGRIQSQVEALVDAIEHHNTAAAEQLYVDGHIAPKTDAGDSSTVYRMLAIKGSEDYEAEDIQAVVIGQSAEATFHLSARMTRGDSTVGRMGFRLRLGLEKVGDAWKFVPGHERQELAM